MPRSVPRAARWAAAAAEAELALTELLELQQEYQDWYDGLPENLAESTVAEKLQVVCDLDLQGALDTVQEITSDDLPKGFGRD